MKILIKVIVFVIVITIGATASTASPLDPIEYDILFSYSEVSQVEEDFRPNHLGTFSAITSEATLFYVDEEASGVRPVAWSPSGHHLAMLKFYWSDDLMMPTESEICILWRDGELIACFEQRPPPQYGSTSFQEDYNVTWSENEEMVYYIAEQDDMRRLIEVEVATGETKRILFETEAVRPNDMDGVWPVTYTWSPDLGRVVTGIGEFQPHFELVNIETHQTSDLSVIFDSGGDKEPNTAHNRGFICGNFSPINHYLIAIEHGSDQTSERIIVFSQELEIIFDIDSYPTEIQGAIDVCPFWSMDESLLYFTIRDIDADQHFFAGYSLDEQIYKVFQLIPPNLLRSTIQLSPDENYIVFVIDYGISVRALTLPLNALNEHELLELAPQWGYSDFPVWIP